MDQNQNPNEMNRPETEQELSAAAPEAAPEKKEAPAASPKRDSKRKNPFGSSRFKRGGMATLMSVVFIAIVVVINVLVGVLTDRFPSMNIDLTAEKLNSLSEQALEIAKGVNTDATIYLIGEEDAYRKNQLYSSYHLEYSQVVNLAEKMAEANSKISVEFVDPDVNPGFISEYPEENLTSGSVLVKTEKRHKALYVTDLFNLQANQETYRYDTYSKVDSALANALEMVNLDKVPIIAIATGHQEMLTSDVLSSFTGMMEDQNFEIREIDFLTEEIPEGTQVLLIPTPNADYTQEEIDKLHAFVSDNTRKEDLAILVTAHVSQGKLPRLEGFLEEWGIALKSGMAAESDTTRVVAGNQSYILVDPVQDNFLTENTYNNLISPASRPLNLLFAGNGEINTHPLWETSEGAFIVTSDMKEMPADPETAKEVVAAIGYDFMPVENINFRRSVIVFGSSYVFTGNFINATAYGDRSYLLDLLQFCTGTDASAVAGMTRQVQTNVLDVAASQNTVNLLGLGLFTICLPLAILIAGFVVFLRRRHL